LTIAASAVLKVTSSDPSHATVSPATLTFTPGDFNTKQTISIVSVHDDDTQDDAVNVTITADGLAPRIIAVTVKDVDKQTLIIDPGVLMLDEGAKGTFTVKLAHNPRMATTVNLLPSNSAKLSLTPSTLNFDAVTYMTIQTVTVQSLPTTMRPRIAARLPDRPGHRPRRRDRQRQGQGRAGDRGQVSGAPGDLVLQEGAPARRSR